MSELFRPKYPKQKNVLVICDIPTKGEVASGDRFSAVSNMNLLSSLTTGRVYMGSSKEEHTGVSPIDMYGTYLDYNYFEEGNYDFKNDFCKRKDLRVEKIHIDSGCTQEIFYKKEDFSGNVEHCFYPLEHQKDCYISHRLMKELEALLDEIRKVNPKIIVVTGKWGLFLLTGCTTIGQNMGTYKDRKPLGGLNKFRSSIMEIHPCWNLSDIILIPIYHPVNAVAMPDKIPIMELDLQKIGWMYHTVMEKGVEFFTKPKRELILGTSKEIVIKYLQELLDKLEDDIIEVVTDIETKQNAMIDCIGFSYEDNKAICIPFATQTNPNFWKAEDELEIMILLRELTIHKNVRFILQSGSYDAQYFYIIWGLNLKVSYDTLIIHHVLYNSLPKSLDFMASLYCTFYSYWKNMQSFK